MPEQKPTYEELENKVNTQNGYINVLQNTNNEYFEMCNDLLNKWRKSIDDRFNYFSYHNVNVMILGAMIMNIIIHIMLITPWIKYIWIFPLILLAIQLVYSYYEYKQNRKPQKEVSDVQEELSTSNLEQQDLPKV